MTQHERTNRAAKSYHKMGFNVFAWQITDNGKKIPKMGANYERWYESKQTQIEVERMFSNPTVNAISIALIGDLECIDIDQKNYHSKHLQDGTLLEDYLLHLHGWDDNPNFDINNYLIQKTRNAGYHVLYRSPNASPSKKLASLDKLETDAKGKKFIKPEVVIETRGTRSNLWVYPTEGYEFTNGDLRNVPSIADKDREWLIKSAIRMGKEANGAWGEKLPNVKNETTHNVAKVSYVSDSLPPWEDFDKKTTAEDLLFLLESNGWSKVGEKANRYLMKRPGGTKAAHSGCIMKKSAVPCLFVWSTSTRFESEKCHSPSHVFAVLEHGGDHRASAKALIERGYGGGWNQTATAKTKAQSLVSSSEPKQRESSESLLKSVQFKYEEPIDKVKPILSFNWKEYGKEDRRVGIIGKGEILGVYGAAKSKKSRLLSMIQASAIGGGKNIGGWVFNPQGKGVHFDTEQNKGRFQKLEHQKIIMSGNKNFSDVYDSYYLRQFSEQERQELVFDHITQGNYSWCCLDGIVDLCTDYNSLERSKKLIGDVMKLCDQKNVALIAVLHIAASSMKARGHLGTELVNKQDYGISLTVNKEESGTSLVEPYFARGAEFKDYKIKTNQYGFPYTWSADLSEQDEAERTWDIWNPQYEQKLGIKPSFPESDPIDQRKQNAGDFDFFVPKPIDEVNMRSQASEANVEIPF